MRDPIRLLAVAVLLVFAAASGFAILGPPHLLRSQAGSKPSASSRPSTTPSPRCATPTPSATGTPSPSGPPLVAFPLAVWVNSAAGANLRTEPRLAAPRLGTLPRDTAGQTDRQAIDASGAAWYRVTANGQTGWIRGDLLMLEPIKVYDGSSYGFPGWSLIVPRDSSLAVGSEMDMQSGSLDRPYWNLTVRTAPSAAALPPPVPNLIGAEYPQLYERSRPIGIWTYTTTARTVRASFDTCRYGGAFSRFAHGWPYVTSAQVVTPSRAYQFLFITEEPDAPIIQQVLDSIFLN